MRTGRTPLRRVATAVDGRAAAAWLEGAKAGTIRTRTGSRYKPSALRSYDSALKTKRGEPARSILGTLGGAKLADVQRRDVRIADELLADGADASTIRNTMNALRVIFRRAQKHGEIVVNPTDGLELPQVKKMPKRIVPPAEAAELLAALPAEDRALWATAFYGGLRRGELRALRWESIDLPGRTIKVLAGWDDYEGEIDPKSEAGRRTVPIAGELLDYLLEHKLEQGRDHGLVFGSSATCPFTATNIRKRALRAWRIENERRTKEAKERDEKLLLLNRIGLHECRHTCASLFIAAGANIKTVSTIMGHSSITITLDLDGHLLLGAEQEAAALLDAFLLRADTAARLEQLTA